MRKYNYKVHIIFLDTDIKFNCSTITFINKYLRKCRRNYGNRFNMIIRNYHTNDIIQDCSVYRDLSVFNRYDSSLKLIKSNNLFYIVNHEKDKICK